LLRDKYPLVNKSIAAFRYVGRKNTDLAVIYFSDGATILSGHSDGVLSLFEEAGFIKDDSRIRTSKVIVKLLLLALEPLDVGSRTTT